MSERRPPRTRADECYDAAADMQQIVMKIDRYLAGLEIEKVTLEVLESAGEPFQEYVDVVLRAGAAYGAPGEWIGPLCFALDEADQERFRKRLVAYRQKLMGLKIGRG